MGAGASSGVISKSINEAAERGNNVNQGSGSNAKSSSNKPAPIDTSNLTGAANDSKKRSASIVGKSTFRALLSIDEKELVVGRSPGSRLRKLAGTDEETPTRLAQLSGKQIKKAQKKLQKKSGGPVKPLPYARRTPTRHNDGRVDCSAAGTL